MIHHCTNLNVVQSHFYDYVHILLFFYNLFYHFYLFLFLFLWQILKLDSYYKCRITWISRWLFFTMMIQCLLKVRNWLKLFVFKLLFNQLFLKSSQKICYLSLLIYMYKKYDLVLLCELVNEFLFKFVLLKIINYIF